MYIIKTSTCNFKLSVASSTNLSADSLQSKWSIAKDPTDVLEVSDSMGMEGVEGAEGGALHVGDETCYTRARREHERR